jgi:prepilin-type N-terminal cleavage/methylation domain-containing protein/prepilin-type processing-associated H-X9-DG protein
MKPPASPTANPSAAFTLIELILVIAIVALLASLAIPAVAQVQQRADSMRCFNNLHQIGVSVHLYLADHENTYPYVQPNPKQPLTAPEYADAKGMLDTFGPYGVTDKLLQCPSDLKAPNANYYAETGSSYLWSPMLDGDVVSNPITYRRRGAYLATLSRMKQAEDGHPVHNSHSNRLYADGHVVSF